MNRSVIVFSVVAMASQSAGAQDALQEIIVTSSRSEVPLESVAQSVSVIDRAEIERSGFIYASDILRAQPGVSVTNTGGPGQPTAVRIRGEEGYRTLMLIDGVEVSDPTGTQFRATVEHMGLGPNIERIEVLRGPQGFIYGADAGGIVNIVTRQGREPQATFRVEAGGYDNQVVQASASGGNGAASAFLSASRIASDGFNARKTDLTGEADGYDNSTLHAKLTAELNAHWHVQLVARESSADTEFDQCYYVDELGTFLSTDHCLAEFEHDVLRVSSTYRTSAVRHQFSMSGSDIQHVRYSAGALNNDADGRVAKAEYVGHFDFDEQWALVGGLDYKNAEMRTTYTPKSDQHQTGVFGELRFNYAERLYLSGGLRYDDHEVFGEHLSGRIAAVYSVPVGNGWLRYRATAGTGFRAPSLYEVAHNEGAPEPLPELHEELSSGGDIGLEYSHPGGTVVGGVLFDQNIRDEIQYDNVNNTGYLQSDGVSHSQGAELYVEHSFYKVLGLRANYTYNETLAVDDGPRLRRPKHHVNVSVIGEMWSERFKYAVHVRRVGDAVDVAQQTLEEYSVIDGNLIFQPVPELKLHARVSNAADRNYQEAAGYNTAGRTFHAGVEYQF